MRRGWGAVVGLLLTTFLVMGQPVSAAPATPLPAIPSSAAGWEAALGPNPSSVYPGATVLAGRTTGQVRGDAWRYFTRSGGYRPKGSSAYTDLPQINADGCLTTGTTPLTRCVYGVTSSRTKVAVVGDSKIAQWHSALDRIARKEGWRLEVYPKSACSFSVNDYKGTACKTYNTRLRDRLLTSAHRPKMVLVSGVHSSSAITAGYDRTLGQLERRGVKIVIIDDNPTAKFEIPRCLSGGADYYRRCGYPPIDGSGSRSLRDVAARHLTNETFIEMDRWICPSRTSCPPVIGRVAIFRKGSHLTDTYVRSLTPALDHALYRAGVTRTRPLFLATH